MNSRGQAQAMGTEGWHALSLRRAWQAEHALRLNQGALTFHVGFSRLQDLDHPDFVLFDLDPGEASFADVVSVARKVHDVLQHEGHASFVKTSGKSGLHVLVAWKEEGNFDEARG